MSSQAPSASLGSDTRRLGETLGARSRIILLTVVLLLCGAFGLVVAMAFAPNEEAGGTLVKRVRNGVTETGRVETVTSNGVVKRVIHWRTRAGEPEIQTVEGPVRLQTLSGEPIYVAGPSHTSTVFGTTTLPSGTVIVTGPSVTSVTTLPAQTVRETVTQTLPAETVTETVHDTSTVTETVHDTVTEVVTETVTAPSP
jgi:hypothetical protein